LSIGLVVTVMRVVGEIDVPGYTATVIVISFFGALNTLGIGLVGTYAWRAYENTKRRPHATIQSGRSFGGTPSLAETSWEAETRVDHE
jgi:uncharacterized RDD family membrane protein YckC